MMTIGCVLLAALCLALAVRVYLVEKSLRSSARQLRRAQADGSAVCLRLGAPNGAAEALISAVNALLELRESDEAAYHSRERALRQQISNVSHDLRTPLTSILGYLQLLEGENLSEAERREYLAVISGRAKSLQSLITSFYDLSRLEGGEYPLALEQVDLSQLLASLLASFYGDFTDAGFEVTVDLAEHLPPVLGDPAAILRVFTNLVRNALDHGQSRLTVRLYRDGDGVVSEFSNETAEAAAEDIGHVFDRFFTSDKMRTGRNTGLGLAIVKALTAQMGHQVAASLVQGLFTIKIRWNCERLL